MTIIKLLKPFEKTLENRRFKIVLYLFTCIILAPIAAYLDHIGFSPVHIIWSVWLLVIPVTHGIYFIWSRVTTEKKETLPDMFEPVGTLTFYDKNVEPIELELALSTSNSGFVPAFLQAEFPSSGVTIRFRFLGRSFVVAELIQLEEGSSVVLKVDSKQFSLSLRERKNIGSCESLGIGLDKDKWRHLEDTVRNIKVGVIHERKYKQDS